MTAEVQPYSGWRPRKMRRGYPEAQRNGSGGASKSTKNTRLSKTRVERHIYCSPHGHRTHPDIFERMTDKAYKLNGQRRPSSDSQSSSV